MKIKTIVMGVLDTTSFDSAVNAELGRGWILKKREVIPGTPGCNGHPRLLYAELIKEEVPEK